jgi:hypothetical protein
MNRKKSKLLMLTLALTSVLMTAVIVNAKPLYGEAALYFTGPANPVWSGTISGDINGLMFFYATEAKDVGQVHYFWEEWEILDFDGTLILSGIDNGVFSNANSKGRMNGVVLDANEEYAHLIGHNVHMSGTVNWAKTPPCLLVFRVN